MGRALCLATLLLTMGMLPVAQGGEVTVVGDKCIQVDGEPLFVIGIYSVGDPAEFPMLAEAGFNTVQTYSWEGQRNPETGRAWLDAAHEAGLKCLVGLFREDVRAMEFDSAVRRIETYRDHPALLAWHTMDEPSWDKEGDEGQAYMPAVYELVKQHDPNHPVTAVVCHFGDTKLFEPSLDVLQADYYPVPPIPIEWYAGKGFRGVRTYAEKWRENSGGKKPYWYVGQIFDFSVSKEEKYEVPEEWKRLPTGEEVRCMTYTAVASGARGVFYWSLNRLIRDEWNRTLLGRVRLWDDLKAVVGELNALMPMLTADTPESIQTTGSAVAMVKSDGTDTYVIVANHERKATTIDVTLAGFESVEAEVLFDDGAAPVTDGVLSVDLAPIESRVYRIKGKHTD